MRKLCGRAHLRRMGEYQGVDNNQEGGEQLIPSLSGLEKGMNRVEERSKCIYVC